MQFDVRLKGITMGRTLREQIVDHLDASLRRLSRRIHTVTVLLKDANGPRGGVDKNCEISVHLYRGGSVRSGRIDANPIAAINVATDRVTRAVVRRLERRRRRAARTKEWTLGEE